MRVLGLGASMTPDRNGDASQVAKALADLPADVRQAVVLAYYRSLTIPDLAHLLASDSPVVHQDLHRGVHDLLAAIRAKSATP